MTQVSRSRKVRRRELKAEWRPQRRINRFGRIPASCGLRFRKICPRNRCGTVGMRPVVPCRQVLGGIVYRLRTGCQWQAVPAQFGSGRTCHRQFRE